MCVRKTELTDTNAELAIQRRQNIQQHNEQRAKLVTQLEQANREHTVTGQQEQIRLRRLREHLTTAKAECQELKTVNLHQNRSIVQIN